MSKKITESMLKGLVEQVLNEKGLPVRDIGTKDTATVKGELGIGNLPGINKIKSIANAKPDSDDLEKIDFEEVFNKDYTLKDTLEDNVEKAEDALEIWYYSTFGPEVKSKILDAYKGSNYNLHTIASTKAARKKHKFKYMIDQNVVGRKTLTKTKGFKILTMLFRQRKAALEDDPRRAAELAAKMKEMHKKFKADKSLTQDELIQLDRIFQDFDESDVTVPSMDLPLESTFDASRTFGKIPSATLSVFNKFKSDAKTADQITKKLILFSNLIKDSANGDDEAIESLQSIAKKDPGMIISAGMILKYFSMVIAEISAMEAGKFFEAFSAMLFSGKVVGGDAGASDVFFYDSDRQKIFTSQKLYSSLEGVKQKIGKRSLDGKGIWAETADANTIFYFCGIKNDSQKTSSVDVYICGLSRITNKKDEDVFYLLDKNGKRTNIQAFVEVDGNVSIGKAIALNKRLFKVGTIPVVDDLADPEQIRTMDSLLSRSYENVASEALGLSKVIFSNAKKLEVEAVNYTQSTNVRDQMNTADSLISGYDEIKSNLGGFIESFAQEEYKMGWSKSWAKDKAASVTESMLKKLIEENFKK